jgi:TPR repeat protein
MRKLLVCCFVVLLPSVLLAKVRPTDPSDFNLSAKVADVTPIIGNSCEIEAVIGDVLYGLGTAMGQGCPLSVGTYDHVRRTKYGFDFLLYDTKKQKSVIKGFSIVGEHLLPSPVITAPAPRAQESVPPASGQKPETFTTSQLSEGAQGSLPPALGETGIAALKEQAGSGNAAAQCGLGNLYHNGVGVPQDNTQAAFWYRKAAEQGDALAQALLGAAYTTGQGVLQDNVQAVFWFRKAAEQGNALAQFSLGYLYRDGDGVPQDRTQAAAWFRKAAEQGDADAQYSLGMTYVLGQGVPQDNAQAAAWFRKAAEQGDADAQYTLGELNVLGQGVPQDWAEAYFWLDLAAAGKPRTSNAKDVATARDEILSHLTPADLSREQERARKWFEAHRANPQ